MSSILHTWNQYKSFVLISCFLWHKTSHLPLLSSLPGPPGRSAPALRERADRRSWLREADMEKSCFSPGEMMKDDDTDERDLHIKMLFLLCIYLLVYHGLPGGKQTCQPLQLRMCVQKLGMPWSQWFIMVLPGFAPSLSASLPLPCSCYHVVLAARRYVQNLIAILTKLGCSLLVGGWPTPLKNVKVRLDHHPNYWGK